MVTSCTKILGDTNALYDTKSSSLVVSSQHINDAASRLFFFFFQMYIEDMDICQLMIPIDLRKQLLKVDTAGFSFMGQLLCM